MKTLHAQIIDKFLERIAKSERIDEGKRRRLRRVLEDIKKPKADDFLKVFSHEEGDVR